MSSLARTVKRAAKRTLTAPTLGVLLRSWRSQDRLTLENAAAGLSVQADQLNRYERDEDLPTIPIAQDLARMYIADEFQQAMFVRIVEAARKRMGRTGRRQHLKLASALLSTIVDVFERRGANKALFTRSKVEVAKRWSCDYSDPAPCIRVIDNAGHLCVANVGDSDAHTVRLLFSGPASKTISTIPRDSQVIINAPADGNSPVCVEFASEGKVVYLQALTEVDATPVPFKQSCISRLRTWLDVNRFIAEVLKGQPFDILPTLERRSIEPNWAVYNILKSAEVEASQLSSEYGFRPIVTELNGRPDPEMPECREIALMSDHLNIKLWDEDIRAEVEPQDTQDPAIAKRVRIESFLQQQKHALTELLRMKAAEVESDASRAFWNEEKICLATDVLSPLLPVRLFRGTYFHGSVTNDAVPLKVGENDGCLADDSFPAFGNRRVVRDISQSQLAHRLGGSTLLVTADRKIVLWRQLHGQRNEHRLVPSATGSLDWLDWEYSGATTLTAAAIYGIERELREESSLHSFPGVSLKTKIIAYFRWLLYGGQPQFIGITMTNDVFSKDIQPDPDEVELPRDLAQHLVLDAGSPDALDASLVRFRACTELPESNLTLWVALNVLGSRCRSDERLRRWLWGRGRA